MITPIKPNIFQLHFRNFGSCVYVLKINNRNFLIDVSSKDAEQELLNDLRELRIKPKDIDAVIITHNHYDHIGNFELFSNAKLYRAEELNENSMILEMPEMKIIETPGHTPESKCFLYEDILFSGDTIFHKGGIGRTDFPGGDYKALMDSIKKLKKIKYKILCPGHV